MKTENLTAPEALQALMDGKRVESVHGTVWQKSDLLESSKNYICDLISGRPYSLVPELKTDAQEAGETLNTHTEANWGTPGTNHYAANLSMLKTWVRAHIKEQISKLKSELS